MTLFFVRRRYVAPMIGMCAVLVGVMAAGCGKSDSAASANGYVEGTAPTKKGGGMAPTDAPVLDADGKKTGSASSTVVPPSGTVTNQVGNKKLGL